MLAASEFNHSVSITRSKSTAPFSHISSIIAVHGLASHPAGTWKSKSNNDIWIRDWIPEDIGNVRVLLYGYECGLQDSDSWSSIEDLSSMLLDNLTAYRRQFQVRFRRSCAGQIN